jgi:hypothetical protein
MTLDTDAWDAGFDAGIAAAESGEPSCPYPPASRQAWSWHCGFIEGKASRSSRPIASRKF